jgi:DNA-binding XRE family transcriptional regulator
MDFLEYLSKRRKELGISQSELAVALGYSDTAICKIESGISAPPMSILPALANKLSLRLDDLLLLSPEPQELKTPNLPYSWEIVAHNLRAVRLANHMRQKEAAEKIGVNKRSLVTYEKGDACPNIQAFFNLMPLLPSKPSDFFYEILYPEIQSSPSFYRRGPSRFLTFSLGLLVGGAVLGSILGPILETRSSSSHSGPYNGVSSNSSSETVGGVISSPSSTTTIPFMDELVVIGPDGIAFDAAMKPNSSIKISVYTGTNYTEQMRKNTTFEYGLETSSSLITKAPDPDNPSGQIITVGDLKLPSWDALFTVTVQAYTKFDTTNVVKGIPLNITVNDTGTLTD